MKKSEFETLGPFLPWETTAERYVGFFDIMGFGSFVRSHQDDHAAIRQVMNTLHDVARDAEEIHLHSGRGLHPALDHRGSQLRVIHFSDSILVLTRDASNSARPLMQLVSQKFFLQALRLGIVLRGAIACGTVTADFEKSIFFGQPIVDAYRLEEDQAWYGIVEHSSADESSSAGSEKTLESLSDDEIP